uniref:Elongation factor 1-gamma n=1 Tax=Callorhinchus milii TaxID=7868 RepID=A0A4W3I4P3_CALMI
LCGATLYTCPSSWRAYLVLIAAQYSNFPLKLVSGAPEFHPETGEATEHFPSIFPLGQVPVLVGDGGFYVSGSNAAAFYVSSDVLRGSSGQQSALVQQWVNFTESELVSPAATWVLASLGLRQTSQSVRMHAREDVQKVLSLLNGHLRSRPYLLGEQLTLADITLVCAVLELFKLVLEPSLRERYVDVSRWFNACVSQSEFRRVLGEVELCLTAAEAAALGRYPTAHPEPSSAIEGMVPARVVDSPQEREAMLMEVGAEEKPVESVESVTEGNLLPDVVLVDVGQARLVTAEQRLGELGDTVIVQPEEKPAVDEAIKPVADLAGEEGQSLLLIVIDAAEDERPETSRVDDPDGIQKISTRADEATTTQGTVTAEVGMAQERLNEAAVEMEADVGTAKPLIVSIREQTMSKVVVVEERVTVVAEVLTSAVKGMTDEEEEEEGAEVTQEKEEGIGVEVMVGALKEERAVMTDDGEEREAVVEEERGMEVSKGRVLEVTEEVPAEMVVTVAEVQEEVVEVPDEVRVPEVEASQEPTEIKASSVQPEEPGAQVTTGGPAKEMAEVTGVDDESMGRETGVGPPREEMPIEGIDEAEVPSETNGSGAGEADAMILGASDVRLSSV